MIGLTAHEAARYQILYSSLDTSSDTLELVHHNVQINARTLTRLSSLGFKVEAMVLPPHPSLTTAPLRRQNASKTRLRSVHFGVHAEDPSQVTPPHYSPEAARP